MSDSLLVIDSDTSSFVQRGKVLRGKKKPTNAGAANSAQTLTTAKGTESRSKLQQCEKSEKRKAPWTMHSQSQPSLAALTGQSQELSPK